MDPKLTSLGYDLETSRYSPALGYSRLRVLISGKPTQRFFDVRLLSIPTFDGRFYHHTQITRHELEPTETFLVCLGELKIETYQGETMNIFSLGGNLRASVNMGDLYCEYNSNAPIFKVETGSITVSGVIVDEIMDLLAEEESKLPGHEDELYSRLSKFEPYSLFLSCLVSLQKRVDSIPIAQRREGYHRVVANLKHAIQIVRDSDNWDGRAPTLQDLLSNGGA